MHDESAVGLFLCDSDASALAPTGRCRSCRSTGKASATWREAIEHSPPARRHAPNATWHHGARRATPTVSCARCGGCARTACRGCPDRRPASRSPSAVHRSRDGADAHSANRRPCRHPRGWPRPPLGVASLQPPRRRPRRPRLGVARRRALDDRHVGVTDGCDASRASARRHADDVWGCMPLMAMTTRWACCWGWSARRSSRPPHRPAALGQHRLGLALEATGSDHGDLLVHVDLHGNRCG